jgi:unsaturated chondroitin disaccharide hydrolase
VGQLWLCYTLSGDPLFEAAARRWAAHLAPRQADETTHDLGFLFDLSHVLGFQATGEASFKAPALTAARTLARRFNRRGRFIQAWGPLDAAPELRGRAIIDTLMNLRLLYWAGQESSAPNLAEMATATAHTCRLSQVRPDFSTAHVADYDPDSGAFLRQETHQGFSPQSCWSRGQSWAVYGFAEAYRCSREADFLAASRGLAEYALAHLPPDGAPYWDYASPLIPNDLRDSSAGAILAAGLLKLAAVDQAQAGRWRQAAARLVELLYQNYSSRGSGEPGVLLHGTRSKPHGLVDHCLVYGDYYFLEALILLTRPGLFEPEGVH